MLAPGKRRASHSHSEASFLKRRRQSIEDSLEGSKLPDSLVDDDADVEHNIEWTEAHEREVQFCATKRLHRLFEALEEGYEGHETCCVTCAHLSQRLLSAHGKTL